MFGMTNPLNAMQILFINILMDGASHSRRATVEPGLMIFSLGPPSQSLGVDPVDHAVMRKPPRKKDEPIIDRRILMRVIFSATIIVSGTLFIYYFAISDAHMSRRDQTMVRTPHHSPIPQYSLTLFYPSAQTFTCFVFLDLVSAIQNRGLDCGITRNRMLLTTVAVSFLSQLGLVYIPFMQAVFQTEALPLDDLLLLVVLAAASFVLHESRRRYERSQSQSETYATAMEELA